MLGGGGGGGARAGESGVRLLITRGGLKNILHNINKEIHP